MKFKPIIIVAGEPNSIFTEIFLKIIHKKKFQSPIVLICSKKILLKQLRALKENLNFNEIDIKKIFLNNFKFKKLNVIDIDFDQNKAFQKISSNSNKYIEKSFEIGLKIMKSGISNKLINGPISKKNFLKKKIYWRNGIFSTQNKG